MAIGNHAPERSIEGLTGIPAALTDFKHRDGIPSGELEKAMSIYSSIRERAELPGALRARALLCLGRCQRKFGRLEHLPKVLSVTQPPSFGTASLERRVALKVLPGGILADSRAIGRFVREAKLAGSLQHPNVVPVFGLECTTRL
jgi:serine/threonine protein kinase